MTVHRLLVVIAVRRSLSLKVRSSSNRICIEDSGYHSAKKGKVSHLLSSCGRGKASRLYQQNLELDLF